MGADELPPTPEGDWMSPTGVGMQGYYRFQRPPYGETSGWKFVEACAPLARSSTRRGVRDDLLTEAMSRPPAKWLQDGRSPHSDFTPEGPLKQGNPRRIK
jgi:hypothetical protein